MWVVSESAQGIYTARSATRRYKSVSIPRSGTLRERTPSSERLEPAPHHPLSIRGGRCARPARDPSASDRASGRRVKPLSAACLAQAQHRSVAPGPVEQPRLPGLVRATGDSTDGQQPVPFSPSTSQSIWLRGRVYGRPLPHSTRPRSTPKPDPLPRSARGSQLGRP